jgi:hypothetical protein
VNSAAFQPRSTSMKRASSKARGKALQSFPFENNKLDFGKFKADPAATEIAKLTWPDVGIKIWPFVPIENIRPTKTIGLGRTNLTLVSPTILQTDASTPYAGFGDGDGTISVHFEPIAYGITSVATYIMAFNIQTFGSATFILNGYVGSGSLPNAGTKTFNGSVTVQLVMKNVQPYQQTYGYLRHTSGARWNWYSTVIKFPDIVVTLP